jgi:hypothetical protein
MRRRIKDGEKKKILEKTDGGEYFNVNKDGRGE